MKTLVKIFPSLLSFVLMMSSVLSKRLPLENKTGTRVLTLDTENKTKEDCNQDVTGIRRVVSYDYSSPNKQCYKQFFVGGQPPVGLRASNNGDIRYICQPPTPQPPPQQAQDTLYATTFDEQTGIAVFSAYTLTQATVQFADREAHPWCRTPGILRQGNQAIYRHPQPVYVKGHLVPTRTYSGSQIRYDSTYTYTNCVPQRPAFNTGMWSQFERRIRNYATNTCTQPLPAQPGQPGQQGQPAGTLYLLTGTSFARIQQQQNGNPQAITGVAVNQIGQIAVPNSLWTAGCCVRQDGQSTRSFAVMGNNVLNTDAAALTRQITVAQLQNILAADVTNLNIGGPNVDLFPGDPNCLNNNLGNLPPAGGGR